MAITAVCSVQSPSWVINGQPVRVQCVISSTEASDVTVTSVMRSIVGSTQSMPGEVQIPANANRTVPAGGSLTLNWQQSYAVGLKPASTEFQFSVGATIYTSNGAVTAATAASVVVVPPTNGTPVTPGSVTPYVPAAGPVAAVSTAGPLPGAYPNPPVAGQMRLESNFNSGLVAVGL